MNNWVRRDAAERLGSDPIELFDPASRRFWSTDREAWRKFAGYRSALALRLQRQWIEIIREELPGAALAVTQIDDLFDARMREFLGADAAALLPLATRFDFTLVIEDPATLWSLGPQRYHEIARRYHEIAKDPQRLAIDINVVERYQRVYPTKKQTGTELFQLLSVARKAFHQVLLYFEHSLAKADWDLLPHAAEASARLEAGSLIVESSRGTGVSWRGPAVVDGKSWPAADDSVVWLPAGRHTLGPADGPVAARLIHLNGELLDASATRQGLEFQYRGAARAFALLDREPRVVEIDGLAVETPVWKATRHWSVMLPGGVHQVRVAVTGLLP
jgi:hypothetical protein